MSDTETIFATEPKTIREALVKMLVTDGLWAKQAHEVFARFQEIDAGEPMTGRWDDAPEAYPQPMLAILH